MIKISYREIRQGAFIQALNRLCNNGNLPQRASYNAARISAKLQHGIETCQQEFFELVAKYAIKNEKGEIVADPKRGPGSFTIQEDKVQQYQEELVKFDEKTIEVDRQPIYLKDLEQAKMTPNEYLALGSMITEDMPPKALTLA